jgi:acetyltransferase-like isoleucine patch superfamily enzyme
MWLCILAALLPQVLKLSLYRLWGWQIGRDVRVGLSVIHAHSVVMAEGVRIGHGNIFKNLRVLDLGRNCYIRHLNQFFAQTDTLEGPRALTMGEGAQIMSRHFFDLSGRVDVGDTAVVGGRDTQVWTHSQRRVGSDREIISGGVVIGPGAYVGARATLVECEVSADSVVAAGAVVSGSAGKNQAPNSLYRGNPAVVSELRSGQFP